MNQHQRGRSWKLRRVRRRQRARSWNGVEVAARSMSGEGGEEAEEVGEAMWLPTASRCHASFFFQGRTGGAEGDSAHP